VPTIKIDLDPDSFRRLAALAVEKRRPIPWQAEVLLIQALSALVEGRPQEAESRAQEVGCASSE
jgi:hypothetical protein